MLKCNSRYVAYPISAYTKGCLAIVKYSVSEGKVLDEKVPHIQAHVELLNDFDLSSINDHIVLTCSADRMVR